MSERAFPAPSTVSEQARAWLAFDVGELAYPAADDIDGWLALAAQANQSTAQRFPISEMPVSVEGFEAGNAVGYTARPHGVDDEAVFLWLHPGGLLVGGGDACRATTARTALSMGMLVWGVDYRLPPRHPHPAALNDAMSVTGARSMSVLRRRCLSAATRPAGISLPRFCCAPGMPGYRCRRHWCSTRRRLT
ncbi:alpha/beta hydrolase [Amycolatopsis circi]|uniref:alpha/beta hydrolase n=1 Tax=Amycolatopsis circi TaxID=871959 RepID=UPI00244A6F8C|nr:alpha/beta hydrolase [Amycolatopsis circi]